MTDRIKFLDQPRGRYRWAVRGDAGDWTYVPQSEARLFLIGQDYDASEVRAILADARAQELAAA